MNGKFFDSISDALEKFRHLKDKAYRDAYVREHIRIGLPYQIRAMREEECRKWTQKELGDRADKPQNVISRIEDPTYGKLTLQTLLELASAFDVALVVKFVPFTKFITEFDDVSPRSLEAKDYATEERELSILAAARPHPDLKQTSIVQVASDDELTVRLINQLMITANVSSDLSATASQSHIDPNASEVEHTFTYQV